jgi:hypothetical protein
MSNIFFLICLGTGHYLWWGVAPKRNVFRGKNVADPTIKKSRIWLPNLKYLLKNKYPPLAKNFTNEYHSVVTHVLYHFCDMSLITACEIFCSLKLHLVCTCTFFGDTICLDPNKSENDQDIDSDWFTYCIDIWLLTLLFSLQYLSESCFGNDIKLLLPNPWVVLFFIYPTFYSLKISFTQPFSLRCHPPPPPTINNDWSLNARYYR